MGSRAALSNKTGGADSWRRGVGAPWGGTPLGWMDHPAVLFWQAQGIVIVLGLAIGWVYAAECRRRELLRIRRTEAAGHALAFLDPDPTRLSHASQACLPMVSVVMPVKGLSEHSVANWKTQLSSLYGGLLEFLFVVESEQDPAYTALLALEEVYHDECRIRVLVAGLATQTSQKIHNQLTGVAALSSKSEYVLFLDDDITLHPGTIGALVREIEVDPEIFLVTGYPFDLPSGSFWNYCCMSYHLPLLIGFSTGGRTFFVWGGCMLMRSADWREDRYGVASAFRYGGYSDDLILASLTGANNRTISCPAVAVFPYRLSTQCSFKRYWNYLRRQIFVLETYASTHNQLVNRTLFIAHCYLSWGLAIPALLAPLYAFHGILRAARSAPAAILSLLGSIPGLVLLSGSSGSGTLPAVQSSAGGFRASESSSDRLLDLRGEGLGHGPLGGEVGHDPLGLVRDSLGAGLGHNGHPYGWGRPWARSRPWLGVQLALGFVLAVFVALAALRYMARANVRLMNTLTPEGPRVTLRGISWAMALLGTWVDNALYPVCALYTMLHTEVAWSKVVYTRRGGRIWKVEHPGDTKARTPSTPLLWGDVVRWINLVRLPVLVGLSRVLGARPKAQKVDS